MNYVRVVRTGSTEKFEDEINKTLSEESIKNKLIDIRYSSATRDGIVIHTAIIIFERL